MQRRKFLKSSLLTGTLGGLLSSASAAAENNAEQKKGGEEYYELRTYTVKSDSQLKLVQDYYEQAAIPAMNRAGSKTIGVFTELKPSELPKLYVVIPFKSIGDFTGLESKLLKDKAYLQTGEAYLNAPATSPAYDRIESSLMKAFQHMPKLETPELKARLFELRRYESASESAGKKKIEMFNTAEIEVFRRVGLTPVFFGETIIGELRPNLTYMLTYDDMAERSKNWKIFSSDPEWKKISSMPEYADAKIVSHITSVFLVPASFSQI